MRFFSYSTWRSALLLAALTPLTAQINSLLTVVPPPKTLVKRNQAVTSDITVQLRNGLHVNSDKPADEYLIPLKITWVDGVAQASETVYPKPVMETLQFSKEPVSVFSGAFKIRAKHKILATAPAGPQTINGKLRYQACSNTMCYPPRSADIKIAVEIRN